MLEAFQHIGSKTWTKKLQSDMVQIRLIMRSQSAEPGWEAFLLNICIKCSIRVSYTLLLPTDKPNTGTTAVNIQNLEGYVHVTKRLDQHNSG